MSKKRPTILLRTVGRLLKLILYVWHQCKMSSSLNCYCKSSLMFCTVSCDSSWKNFSSFRNVLSQFCYIFVVDLIVFFTAEYTNFFSSTKRSSLHRRICSVFFIKSHLSIPPIFSRIRYTIV